MLGKFSCATAFEFILFRIQEREREDVNKYTCQLLSESGSLLITEAIIEIGVYLLSRSGSLA